MFAGPRVSLRIYGPVRCQVPPARSIKAGSGPGVLDLGESEDRQELDIDPTDIELVPLGVELGRVWVVVVIVVELFAAEPDRDRGDVPALVLHFEVAIAERVADAVDDPGGPEGDPHHLYAPDHGADEESEQVEIDRQHQHDPEHVAAGQNVPLEPVVGCALAVLLEHAGLPDRVAIVEGALQDDVAEPFEHGAMRITLAVGERVVFAVAGDPLLGHDGRRQPEPNAHRDRGHGVKRHAAVGLRAVQEQRNAHVREVAGDDHEQNGDPPVRRPASESKHVSTPK